MKTNLKTLSEKELRTLVESHGESPYRAKQIINWIYKKQVTSIEQMTDLPKDLRKELQKTTYISDLKLQKEETSRDGTRKFLFELEDKETIESVLIPDDDRLTLCISSQVGCAMGCKFCITGRIKLKRNLRAYEIVDQIIAVQRLLKNKQRITNIVFMGMGEPLHNFSEVSKALHRIINLLGFSKRKVTLSTVGIPPKILKLAKDGHGINLAISLNATTDKVRNRIMPINKRYPLKQLIDACKRFPLGPYRYITFEYVLLDGINSSREDALRLIRLLKGIKAKVNLIPYNEISADLEAFDKPFRRPPEHKILMFQKILLDAGVRAILRKSKGMDISAACGQLRAGYPIKKQTS
jgi:23S rRNA (adenine2503-C2)-methyltransferase